MSEAFMLLVPLVSMLLFSLNDCTPSRLFAFRHTISIRLWSLAVPSTALLAEAL